VEGEQRLFDTTDIVGSENESEYCKDMVDI